MGGCWGIYWVPRDHNSIKAAPSLPLCLHYFYRQTQEGQSGLEGGRDGKKARVQEREREREIERIRESEKEREREKSLGAAASFSGLKVSQAAINLELVELHQVHKKIIISQKND